MFGVSLADLDALDETELIFYEELPALNQKERGAHKQSNDFFNFDSDGGPEGGTIEPSENGSVGGGNHSSSMVTTAPPSYHQPQQVYYQNQEKRSRKREASGDGTNRRRCKSYRMAKNKIEQQEKEELQKLKDRKDSLEKSLKDLEKSLEMTTDYYLKCISSGRISFSSG